MIQGSIYINFSIFCKKNLILKLKTFKKSIPLIMESNCLRRNVANIHLIYLGVNGN